MKRVLREAGLGVLLAVAVVWPVAAQAAERVALVIGNAAYKAVPLLANPGNDARAVGAAFGRLGYAVTRIEDAGFDALRRGLLDFTRAASAADVAVVFYAGHGMEVDGRNFLVPVDARLASDRDVEYEAVPLALVTRAVGGARRLGLVVLDACRDNPFVARMQSAGGRRSMGRGLARVAPAGGTLVAYAAEDGKTAEDGTGRNSPYTGALLRYLEEPGLEVGRLFRKVRAEVERTTGGAQTPIEYGKLPDADIYLASAAAPPPPPPQVTPPPVTSPPPSASGDMAGTVGAWAWTAGRTLQDCPGCPEMVVVPAGSFRMGSPESEAGRRDDEGPQHRVTIARPLAVGVHEVTFEEWEACVSEGGCGRYRPGDAGWGRGNRPVMNVSWNDAKAYVRWLSRKTGEAYRLLSEAEWEYVARAGTTTARYWGESASGQCSYANGADRTALRHNSDWTTVDCADGHATTAPVGRFQANPFGLHDVLGNVYEWVEDCWNGSYHGAPSDGSAWTSGECGSRVLRGGSWLNDPWLLRSALRYRYPSGFRSDYAGVRVARTLTP